MTTVLTADRLLTVDRTVEPGAVVYDDDGIRAVGRPGDVDRPATVDAELALDGHTLLPGLVDGHVHLAGANPAIDSPGDAYGETVAGATVRTLDSARRTIEAGVTTVRDLGSPNEVVFEVRDRIAAGDVPGPRVLAAGQGLTTTGGHGDKRAAARVGEGDRLVSKGLVFDGPTDARRAVRSQCKRGADLVKVWATDGITDPSGGRHRHVSDAELAAICEEAANRGVPVAAHAHSAEAVRATVEAGVRSVEHGVWMDDDAVDALADGDAYLTLTYATMFALAEEGRWSETARENAAEALDYHAPMVDAARERGVDVAMGTDAGTAIPNGHNGLEPVRMVRGAGFEPREALRACTETSAAMLGLDDEVGRIEPGYAADLLAIRGDPLADVDLLADPANVELVVKGGEIVKDDRA